MQAIQGEKDIQPNQWVGGSVHSAKLASTRQTTTYVLNQPEGQFREVFVMYVRGLGIKT